MSITPQTSLPADGIAPAARPVAVIDIGTSSIRMAIAEIEASGNVHLLERVIQSVSPGKDTFSSGAIRKSTIQDCVRVLSAYREKLNEYRITSPDQIRVVATSAVREASNRLAFLDRIYSATGFLVEPISNAEISRVTYLGILPLLRSEMSLTDSTVLVTEVGGGSTEVLMLRNEDVVHSHTFRLGSLRLRETLASYQASRANARRILEIQIDRTIELIRQDLDESAPVELLALGGDVRFSASQLLADWHPDKVNSLPLDQLEAFADQMLNLDEDQIIHRYHLTLPDAETLGPALLTYVRMARALRLDHILVADFNLRDALLNEMTVADGWSPGFTRQVIRSAVELGRKFEFDKPHGEHVAELARQLFRELADEHRLGTRWEVILYVAALLHEVGLFLASTSYHKHSMYLISNSEIFGLSPEDVRLVALVARYHRRASPRPSHEQYRTLDRDDRVAVAQLAALLRVADSLDQSRSQRIEQLSYQRDRDRFVIRIADPGDLSLEQLALQQSGGLVEEAFGRRVLLRGH